MKALLLKAPFSRAEICLLATLLVALLLAILGPPIAQYANYHDFADQRGLWGLPFAMDVLSNVPFAVGGVWGLWLLRGLPFDAHAQAHRLLAALFFGGLLVTAACSSFYHLHPDNTGLAIDRLGIVVAFAGLTGLALADRVSGRAGWGLALGLLLLGPRSVAIWAQSGNLLPWAVLQGTGMLLVAVLALRRPVAGAWGISLGTVVVLYGLAKALEFYDLEIFGLTLGTVSGHSLKHVAAALAAWPVIRAVYHHVRNTNGCAVL